MLLGAAYLVVRAASLATSDCPPELREEECLLEQGINTELSQLLLYFALGLVLVGLGVLVAVRKKKEAVP